MCWTRLSCVGLAALVSTCLLIGGCPQEQQASPVTATIAASAAQGPAPWSATLSAAASTSINGGALTYLWDFADGQSSDQAIVTHVFQDPGYYLVKLKVTDSTGESSTAAQPIRAEGTGATAAISASATSGPPPLVVEFDGTVSQVPDDTIRDYFWDFGDGYTARSDKPQHTYVYSGTYTVTLTIETGGGLTSDASVTITVATQDASLQFNGSSFARLPFVTPQSRTALTVEAWLKAETDGGTALSLGSGALTIAVEPATNSIRFSVNGVATDMTASSLAGAWRHIAVVYDGGAAQTCVLYLNGAALGSATVSDALSYSTLTIGSAFRGNIGEVRAWNEARTAAAISASKDRALLGTESNLQAYWPCDEGSGQVLSDRGPYNQDGTLGSSTAAETTGDPAWSFDAPPLQ